MSKEKTSSGGIGLATVLVVIFVVLKVTKLITWSWWWVFSPWLIIGGFIIALLIILGIITYIVNKDK